MAHILLIDDDPDILKLASLLLGQAGYEVTTAQSATAGLEQLKTGNFDLLISDANMPEHSGFDLVKVVRALKRFEKLPIALLTARRERQDVEMALGLGVNDYIVKPLEPALLLSKIETLLRPKSAETQMPPQSTAPAPSATTSQGTTGKKLPSNVHVSARVTLDVQLVGLSEEGLEILTHSTLSEGETLTLDCLIFREMGVVPPPLVVRKSEFLNPTLGSQVSLEFKVVNDRLIQKIRTWVTKQDVFTKPAKKAA